MLFENTNIQATYVDKNDLRNYLITKLRETLGFEYEVFVSSTIWENHLGITIDDTTMSPESNQALQDFKQTNSTPDDLNVLTHFIKSDYTGNLDDHKLEIHYLIADLEGTYIIRDLQENVA